MGPSAVVPIEKTAENRELLGVQIGFSSDWVGFSST